MESSGIFGLRFLVLLLVSAVLNVAAMDAADAAIRLDPVLQGLSSPLYITNAHDDSNRLFVVEQGGQIRALAADRTTLTLFLDITSRVLSGGERGLLGLAFHPQFATNSRFFVYYTRQGDGAIVIAEYQALATPAATAASEIVLLTIAHPSQANHNGGMIEFGPDGYLYVGTGDGGSANDPPNNAQNINVLLGKILRLDVDHSAGGLPYSSPPSNPFFGATPGADEIFAVGMRNPFRFSFDRGGTHQLYVGDVGQDAWEEVDIVTVGGNYGWRVYEGNQHCTGNDPGLCTPTNYVAPIAEYGHTGGRCSITGGYVYRGSAAALPAGTYVFGDYCTGEIFSMVSGAASLLLDTTLNISSFGEDEAGELYVVGLGGTVHRIASTATTTTLTSAPNPALMGTSVTFTATVSGANPTGSVTFTEGGNAVCAAGTLSGGTASCSTSSLAVGVHSIVANYAGDANYAPSSSTPRSQVITAADQTISFGALADRSLSASPFTVSATASSGLAVSFSSLTTPVCTVSGTTVTLVATGTCTIRAAQGGNANFNPAPNVDRSFNVTPATVSPLANLGFEAPNLAGAYQYGPAGATWVFTGDAGITGNANGFTSGNPPAPEGVQVAFLERTGQATQTANIAAGTYTLSIRAAQRGNYQFGTQIVRLQVDGVTVGQYTPPNTAYTNYTTSVFTIATSGNHTLSLAGVGAGADYTAFIDDVQLTPTVVAGEFTNGGFEAPNLAGAYQYGPAGATWVFTGDAGITGNANGFTSGNPPAPEGVQVAFLERTGQATQTANIAAGTYTLSLRAAQRGNYQFGTQIVRLQVDGVTVGQYTPPNTAYTNYTTSVFTIATSGNHTLSLAGVGAGADYTAFVDDVQLTPTVVTGEFTNGGFEAPNLAGAYQYGPAGATWVFTGDAGITGNANGFTSGNPPAPEGVQVAFLERTGQATQTANIAAGTYTLSLRAAQRGNYQFGTQIVRLQVDGVTVGQYTPPNTAYTNYTTSVFTIATSGNHTLSLAGVGAGADYTAFVDDVQLTPTVVVTYVLSGTVSTGTALSGVTFAAPGGGNCTVSDAQGQYSCTVPQGWSGSITPSLSGYAFTPAARSYSNVAANQSAQDYAASAIVGGGAPWSTFARDAQHSALSTTASQPLNQVHWQTPMDLQPQYSGTSLLIHYGSPLVTSANTVIVPVKTGATGGFMVEARGGSDGALKWSMTTDYILPPASWIPAFGPALTSQPRLYFPGAGGTVYFRDQPDAISGVSGQIAFYGLSNYQANPQAYNSSVIINTPLTTDPAGNVYFGFQVIGSNPLGMSSGIARIGADGVGTATSVITASGDFNMTKVPHNSAPALSADLGTLYVAVSDGTAGYLVALDSTTLAPLARVRLQDPSSGLDARLSDNGSASPTVGTDGDVYFGVLENPSGSNHSRGWLLHFNSSLSQSKTPGAFGWDDTASLVPAQMVPSYQGTSAYLLMAKYNNYAGRGGDGQNKLAVLDPNATQTDPVTLATVMKEVLTIVGPTPDPDIGGVREWCINSAVVDPATKSILANNEDGKLYRWDLTTNTLSQTVVLTAGLGEAYTSTVIGVDGHVYAINNAILFAVGQ